MADSRTRILTKEKNEIIIGEIKEIFRNAFLGNCALQKE